MLGSISTVLSIALLFTHTAHAQGSNWWEQQKPNTPAATERSAPTPQTVSEQDGRQSNTPAQVNTAKSANSTPISESEMHSYLEVGRIDMTFTEYDESVTGRYIRVALGPPHIQFLGSYQRPEADFSITEIGIGSSSNSEHLIQFTSTLTRQIWKLDNMGSRAFTKLAVGLRSQPSAYFDVWIGAGYMWTPAYINVYNYKGQLIATNFLDTSVINVGFQFLITPDIGIVFDLDTLNDLDIDLFRAGIRVSF